MYPAGPGRTPGSAPGATQPLVELRREVLEPPRCDRFAQAAQLVHRPRQALQYRRTLAVVGGRELERSRQARLRSRHVKRKRPLAGQRQVAASLFFELVCE